MRIMNRKEFLKLPSGQLYRKFEETDFGELCIKRDSTQFNDWYVQYLDWMKHIGEDNEDEIDSKALLDSNFEMEVEFDMSIRDGLFDRDQLFAVYNKDEIREYIKLFEKLL